MMMANYLEHLLAKTNWGLVINNADHLLYVQPTDETSYIEVVKKNLQKNRRKERVVKGLKVY
jgi:hypothetical protein